MTDQDMTEHEAAHQPEAHETPRVETQYPPPIPTPPAAQTASPTTRTPILAALFSAFPGLGNVYNGLYLRGVTFFLIFMGLIQLAAGSQEPESVILVFAVIFVWLFNLFDAYRQATMINYGYVAGSAAPAKPAPSGWGSGGMVAGVVVFLLGFYGLLRDRFDIDLSLLVEYWYLLFMGFGVFLIAQTVMQRRKDQGDGGEDLADL